MTTSKIYDDLVEGFRAKIRGNVESEVMTPDSARFPAQEAKKRKASWE